MTTPLLRPLALSAAAFILASCSSAQNQIADAAPLTEKQLAVMEKQLGGKVAGEPTRCLPNHRIQDSVRVSDNILLYPVTSKLVYRNDLRGSCPGLARDTDVMVIRQYSSSTCSGDLFYLVDRTSGIRGPSCVLGEFTPYRTADASSPANSAE